MPRLLGATGTGSSGTTETTIRFSQDQTLRTAGSPMADEPVQSAGSWRHLSVEVEDSGVS
jgi:hypothetical protein